MTCGVVCLSKHAYQPPADCPDHLPAIQPIPVIILPPTLLLTLLLLAPAAAPIYLNIVCFPRQLPEAVLTPTKYIIDPVGGGGTMRYLIAVDT